MATSKTPPTREELLQQNAARGIDGNQPAGIVADEAVGIPTPPPRFQTPEALAPDAPAVDPVPMVNSCAAYGCYFAKDMTTCQNCGAPLETKEGSK